MQNVYDTDYPGETSEWLGGRMHKFHINGIDAILVEPAGEVAAGRPWFWRARFFGAFPFADAELLKLGWHVAHIDIPELYGAPESNRRFDLLYGFLVSLGFSEKPSLAGYSRGGMDIYSWAAKNTDKVSSLYLDNAVCDFKSCPGGKGASSGDAGSWENCLAAWNMTEEEAMKSSVNPIDNMKPIVDAGIPLLHVVADADHVVPKAENTDVVVKRVRELGGDVTVIVKHGFDHHPHCLENPAPIVGFIVNAFAGKTPDSIRS